MKKIIAAFMCLFIMACSLGEIKTAKAEVYTSNSEDYSEEDGSEKEVIELRESKTDFS